MIANPDAKGIQRENPAAPPFGEAETRNVRPNGRTFLVLLRVEMTGFEPVTPSLRTRCSAGLSYIPWKSTLVDDWRHHCNGLAGRFVNLVLSGFQ